LGEVGIMAGKFALISGKNAVLIEIGHIFFSAKRRAIAH
jgi:hypothetical protein